MKGLRKVLRILVLLSSVLVLGITVFLYINSRERTSQFIDANGNVIENSIAKMDYIEIDEGKQFLLIRGRDKNNPVLLILNGGPGISETPMFRRYNSELENHFTVAYWDQRNTGKSVNTYTNIENFSLQKSVEDTHIVTSYLKKLLDKEQLFLLGHSWGSLLGVKVIEKYPEDYHAFVGTGQFSNQPKSDSLSYAYVLKEATNSKDKKAISKLNEIGTYKENIEGQKDIMNWVYYQRLFLSVFGGAVAKRGSKVELFVKPTIFCGEYSLKEKWNLLKSNSKTSFLKSSFKGMINNVLRVDLTNDTLFKVPIYFIQGKKDYITNYKLALEYFNKIKAPQKKFFSFENSAHFPPFEEPVRFNSILVDLLLKGDSKVVID